MVAAKIANLPKGSNQHAPIGAPSQDDAADMLNVGRRSVQRAREVLERATAELLAEVEQGSISVSRAASRRNVVMVYCSGSGMRNAPQIVMTFVRLLAGLLVTWPVLSRKTPVAK
jgi:hypothetical protein